LPGILYNDSKKFVVRNQNPDNIPDPDMAGKILKKPASLSCQILYVAFNYHAGVCSFRKIAQLTTTFMSSDDYPVMTEYMPIQDHLALKWI